MVHYPVIRNELVMKLPKRKNIAFGLVFLHNLDNVFDDFFFGGGAISDSSVVVLTGHVNLTGKASIFEFFPHLVNGLSCKKKVARFVIGFVPVGVKAPEDLFAVLVELDLDKVAGLCAVIQHHEALIDF